MKGGKKMREGTGAGKILTGIALGAAAGAAAVALSDKNNRKKFNKAVNDLSEKAQKAVANMKKNPELKEAISKSKPVIKKIAKTKTSLN